MLKKHLSAVLIVCFVLQLTGISLSNTEGERLSFMPNATISGDATVCQYNNSPVITFTGSDGTAPYTFTYTIGSGTPQTITSTGDTALLSVPTDNNGTFVYNLTEVQDATGTSNAVLGSNVTIIITEGPDASMGGTGIGTFNGQPVFRICDNVASTFTFTNTSSTTSTLNTNYTINWGDGTSNFTGTTWSSMTHSYDVGIYTLTYTIEGSNGCNTTQDYIVFVGSNPAVSLGNPGNTDICNNAALTFPITGTDNNPPGTIYTVTFNDGSTPQTFTHPPPSSITHTFTNSSCNTTSSDGSNTYANSFSANIVASNPCSSSSVGVVPIYVSSVPVADFTYPTTPSCINTRVCFDDLSSGNTTNGSDNNCNTNPNIVWEITPNTYSINSGTLGNNFGSTDPALWLTGSERLCVNFNDAGTYTITQTVGSRCGLDTVSQTICVEPAINPQFNLNVDSGCTPLAVTATNSTDASMTCESLEFEWQVAYNSDFCGTSPADWDYTNGTNQNSANPSFNFVTPGTYTIALTGSNFCANGSNSQQVIVKQPPMATIEPVNIICNTTAITPSAVVNTCTDDASSVIYDWQFPGATPASSNMQSPGTIDYGTSGTYTFSLQITNDCGVSQRVTETVTIEDVPVITNTDLTQDICSGTSSSDINLTSSVVGTTFSWIATATSGISGFTPSGTGDTIAGQFITTTNTASGNITYTVIPSIGNCDGTPVDFTITVNPAPEITIQPQPSTVCENGTPMTLSVATSATNVQYQWFSNTTNSNTGGTLIAGATNADYIPLTDTVGELFYYCQITFTTGGCSTINSQVASVTVTPNATLSTQPTSENICVGSTITSPLSVTFIDGTGTVSYQWFSNTTNDNTGGVPIVGAINANYTPPIFTTTGNFYYYVELSFAGSGCNNLISNVSEITVVTSPMVDVQPLPTQTLCENSSPQDLEVQASGGIGAFTYQWFSNTVNSNAGGTPVTGETNTIFTPPTDITGTLYYYCLVSQSGSSSCSTVSDTSEVNITPGSSINSQPQSQELCLGDNANTLNISFINGVGTPTYQWYSNTVNAITSGTIIAGATTNTYLPPVVTIGTTYYYCVIMFSSGGCSEISSNTAEIIVNEIPSISNATVSICSGNNFEITPDTSNGDIVTTNTTYTWGVPTITPTGSITGASAVTTPQTSISQTLTNTTTTPSVVTYTVTPTAGLCDGNSFTVDVTVNPAISANMTMTQIDCFGSNNAEIATNITGGVPFTTAPPYIISWTGPGGFTSSNATISNLAPGDYTLTVEDEGGCPFSETYTITEPNELVLTVDTENPISCFGANDAEIAVTVTGGTANYIYNWARNGVPFSTDEDISNLTAATYELTVTDANGCGPVVESFNVIEPNELIVSLVNQTDVDCFGESSGTVEVSVAGGTPTETSPGVFEYIYAWTGPNGFTSNLQNLTGVSGGTYNLTVTDVNGCNDSLSVVLMQPNEITISFESTELLCYGDNDASITITDISGGSGSYTVVWSNFGEGLSQTNLSAGDYTITVTDSNNCAASITVTIVQPPIFTIAPVVTQISCFGANDGSIILNFQGGQDPIDFAWADDSNAGVERNNLAPGSYTINIVDGTPCTISETFTIVEPAELTLSANITNALDCDDAASGAINLLISGGSQPYTVNWSNGSVTEDLDGITEGNYLVNVIDANDCEVSETYTIVRPLPIIINVETQTNVDCNTFMASQNFEAQVSGGVPPYTLNWSSGTVSGVNNELMTTSQNGLVILEAIDNLGCVNNYTFDVSIPQFSDADFTQTSLAFETYGVYSQIDPIQFTNTTTGNFTNVSWDFGDGNFSNEENPIHSYISPGTYTVVQTVSFPEGCVYTKVITLLIEKGYKLIMPNAFTPNTDGLNDFFRPVFIGLNTMELNVYDTWGSLIYSETGDNIQGWDGKIKGEFAENGNYYYTFTSKTFFGIIVSDKGPFTLIL